MARRLRCVARIASKCSAWWTGSCSWWLTPAGCSCTQRRRPTRTPSSRSKWILTRASSGDAGYRIVLGEQGIQVTARTPRGAFYGGVTLWQLLTPPGWTRGTPAEIAEGVIDDHPRLAWRALLLDSGRHFQSVAEIKQLIDWMSLDKLNVLLWHLTEDQGWRLEIPKYPALTKTGACRQAVGLDIELTGAADKPYCGFYTEAEVRDIVSYAAERFVTIVPGIDLPGHSQAAVATYPWLGVTGTRPSVWTDWGISPWLLKPDEKTLRFVDDVLDEVMRLFPSRYISIGGDEADKQQWNASPEVRAQMRRLGLANMDQLQGWFTSRVADYLVKHGRTPVGWDDEVVAGAQLPASEVGDVLARHGRRARGTRSDQARPRCGHDAAGVAVFRPLSIGPARRMARAVPAGEFAPGLCHRRHPARCNRGRSQARYRGAGRPVGRVAADFRARSSMQCFHASPRCRNLGGRQRARATGRVSCSACPPSLRATGHLASGMPTRRLHQRSK